MQYDTFHKKLNNREREIVKLPFLAFESVDEVFVLFKSKN